MLGAFLAMLGAMGHAVEIVSAGLPTLDEMKHRFASLATDDDD